MGVIMEKTIRCTVCTWRGPWEVAESAPRIRAAEVHPGDRGATARIRRARSGERGGRGSDSAAVSDVRTSHGDGEAPRLSRGSLKLGAPLRRLPAGHVLKTPSPRRRPPALGRRGRRGVPRCESSGPPRGARGGARADAAGVRPQTSWWRERAAQGKPPTVERARARVSLRRALRGATSRSSCPWREPLPRRDSAGRSALRGANGGPPCRQRRWRLRSPRQRTSWPRSSLGSLEHRVRRREAMRPEEPRRPARAPPARQGAARAGTMHRQPAACKLHTYRAAPIRARPIREAELLP